MSRPEGLPKTGGRTKGTPNRKSQGLEDALISLGVDVPAQIIELLPLLAPEKTTLPMMNDDKKHWAYIVAVLSH